METNAITYKPNLRKRILATIIDYGLFILFLTAYIMYFGHDNGGDKKTVTGVPALIPLIIWFAYFVLTEAIFDATPAHRLFYLKVVTLEKQKIKFSQALRRRLMDPIDILLYGIPAIIAIKKTEKHQRLGDLWAGTVVIDTSDSAQML